MNEQTIPSIGICHICGKPAKVGNVAPHDLAEQWPSDEEIARMPIHCCSSLLVVSDEVDERNLKLLLLKHHQDQHLGQGDEPNSSPS